MAWSSMKWYGKALAQAVSAGGLNLAGGPVKALLATAAYTPDQDAHDFLDDVTAAEVAGGGYARVDLAEAVTYDALTNTVKFTSGAVTFPGLTATFRHLILFVDTGSAATSPLVGFVSSDADVSVDAQDVTFTPAAGGWLDIAAA